MNLALLGQLLPILVTAFIGLGQSFIKGNKKWVVAIAAYFALKWLIDKQALEAAKNEQVKIDPATGDPVAPTYYNANTLAERYRKAFDPYSTGFLSWNGTDVTALYELAAITYNFETVRSAYKVLYKSDLYDDLRSELSNADMETFNTILNRKK